VRRSEPGTRASFDNAAVVGHGDERILHFTSQMLVRTLSDAKTVDWGNGLSRRLLLSSDEVGYTVTDTLVRAGSRSQLQYTDHIEACYCVEGAGWVVDDMRRSHRIEPGTLYAVNERDAHCLVADAGQDMRLICVFAPALEGDEVHDLRRNGYSSYAAADARVGLAGRRHDPTTSGARS
jgi:L-ectoine synthase